MCMNVCLLFAMSRSLNHTMFSRMMCCSLNMTCWRVMTLVDFHIFKAAYTHTHSNRLYLVRLETHASSIYGSCHFILCRTRHSSNNFIGRLQKLIYKWKFECRQVYIIYIYTGLRLSIHLSVLDSTNFPLINSLVVGVWRERQEYNIKPTSPEQRETYTTRAHAPSSSYWS